MCIYSALTLGKNFISNKWGRRITIGVIAIIIVFIIINNYKDSIREAIETQIQAGYYRNQYNTLLAEKEELEILNSEQLDRIRELEDDNRRINNNILSVIGMLQNDDNLEGGTVNSYLAESARRATRENGVSYESIIGNENEPD